jgi:SAM-dependent methyltransferase
MRRPGKHDVSRPRGSGYAYKKKFYRQADVADDYDFHRFGSPERQRRNVRKWRAIQAALREAASVRSILDLPCGTGRFTGGLARQGYVVVASDISREMMAKAAGAPDGTNPNVTGYVQADAEALPFRAGAVDCVLSIRFMFHVDPATRVRILREMGRVTRRWLIIDYRHRYTLRYAKRKLLARLGLGLPPAERVSSAGLAAEFEQAGLSLRKVIPVTRWFSDKWIVVGESSHAS